MRCAWALLLTCSAFGGGAIAEEKKPHDAQRAAAERQGKYELLAVKYRVKGEARTDVNGALIAVSYDDSLSLRGKSLRFEDNHTAYSERERRIQQHHLVIASDGQSTKMLLSTGFPNKPPQLTGEIHPNRRADVSSTATVLPLLLFARGNSDADGFLSLAGAAPTGKVQMIDGRPCQEFTGTPKNSVAQSYWIDPSLQHNVVRVTNANWNLDIKYAPSDGSLAPSEWIHQRKGSGKVVETQSVTVIEFDAKPVFAPETFDVTFPPGTHFTDDETKQQLIVAEDGTSAVEAGTAEPAPALPPLWKRYWFAFAGGALVLLGIAFLIVRHRMNERELSSL